jgi:ribosome biogenesis ATPase
MKKKPATSAPADPAISIDISSDEEESENATPKIPIDSTKVTVSKVSANGSKVPATTEELATLINSRPGPASQKRRRMEQLDETVQPTKEKPSSTALTTQKPKKFKKEVFAKRSTVKFCDVGGMSKSLEEICELALHIKHPNIYRAIGTTPPRGILLHGPPGSGKTLLAHAIAGELDVFLIEVAATELIAGVSGESEERIREVFEQAASFAPCVLFIDEIDAVSSNRQMAQKDMERRIVAQLLQSFDNLSKMEYGDQVFVIGATNRPDSLDPALRRVGRFDHEICLGIPDRKAREEILGIITKKVKIDCNFDLDEMAALTPGFVGADLYSLVARAASTTVKRFLHGKELEFVAKEAAIKKPRALEPIVSLDDDLLMEVDSTAEAEKAKEKNEDENEQPKESDETPKEETQNVQDTPMEADSKTEEAKEEEPVVTATDEEIKPEISLETMLKFLHNENQLITPAEVENLSITREDFLDALKNVQPSAKREGFITVPDVTWDDIGSLQDIRKELKLSILAPVKYPTLMEKLGIKSPSGVMLWGPPGN